MKNNILLLSPSQKQLYAGKIPYPHLGLLFLSSVLENAGFTTELVEEDFAEKKQLINKLTRNDTLAVFATCTTPLFPRIRSISRVLKKLNGPPVILGGPHASAYGMSSLTEGITAAVRGEGEKAAVEIARRLSGNSDLSGIEGVLSEDGETPAASPAEDIDALPFPNYRLVSDWKRFKPPESRGTPAIPVSFSRGCGGNCIFCSTPKVWGRKVRRMSPERAVCLVEYLVSEFKAREIHITDDDFTGDREWTEDFLYLTRKKNLPVKFYFMNGIRPSNIDKDLLIGMKSANFINAGFGIETASESIYRTIGKTVSMQSYEEAIDLSSKTGLTTWVFYVFGLPGETKETVEKNILHAISSKAHFAKFFILQPYKGTRINELYSKMGFLRGQPEKGLYENTNLQLPGFSGGELEKLLKKAYLKFYLNPKKFFNIIRRSHTFSSGSFLSDVKFVLHMMKG